MRSANLKKGSSSPSGIGDPAPGDQGLPKRPSTPDRLWEEPCSDPAYRYWDLPLDDLPRWAGPNAHLGSGPEALEARENIRRQRGGTATSSYWTSEGPTLAGKEIILQVTTPAGCKLHCRSQVLTPKQARALFPAAPTPPPRVYQVQAVLCSFTSRTRDVCSLLLEMVQERAILRHENGMEGRGDWGAVPAKVLPGLITKVFLVLRPEGPLNHATANLSTLIRRELTVEIPCLGDYRHWKTAPPWSRPSSPCAPGEFPQRSGYRCADWPRGQSPDWTSVHPDLLNCPRGEQLEEERMARPPFPGAHWCMYPPTPPQIPQHLLQLDVLGTEGRVLSCRYSPLIPERECAIQRDLLGLQTQTARDASLVREITRPFAHMEAFLIREAFCSFPTIGNTLIRDLYGFLLTLKCDEAPLKLQGGRFYHPHQWIPRISRGILSETMDHVYIVTTPGKLQIPRELMVPFSVQEQYPAGGSDCESSDSDLEEASTAGPETKGRYAQIVRRGGASPPAREGPAPTPRIRPCILYLNHQGKTYSIVTPEGINDLLIEYDDVFARSQFDLGLHRTQIHDIPTHEGSSGPVRAEPITLSPKGTQELQEKLLRLEEAQMITPSRSAWAAAVTMVPQPNAPWRLVTDYRPLGRVLSWRKSLTDSASLFAWNAVTQMRNARYVSILNFDWGHLQIPVREQDRCKTAITTPFGAWEWKTVPPGFPESPLATARALDHTLSTLRECAFVQRAEVLVFSQTINDHGNALKAVFECLRRDNFKANRFQQLTPDSLALKQWGLPVTTSDLCEGWGCRLRRAYRMPPPSA